MNRSDYIVDRAVSRSWTMRRRLGTVKAVDIAGRVTVQVDQVPDSESTVDASNIAGYLLLGDRVWVDFIAPKGAVAIGRVPSAPLVVGSSFKFNTGWVPGDATYGPATLHRTPTGEVKLTGAATRASGTDTIIMRLPRRLWPSYSQRFTAWTDTSIDLILIGTDGTVSWLGSDPTDVYLDATWVPTTGGGT